MASSMTLGATSTAEEAAASLSSSIAGKHVLVTGASPGGLGAEAARAIAQHGPALLVLAGRSKAKLEETKKSIEAEIPEAKIRLLVLDLASLASVREAAAEVTAYSEPIDVLINNAGIMAPPYSTTVDGFESQFGTNHLGPFLFTNLVCPRLLASAAPRVVVVSSEGHLLSDTLFEDVGCGKGETYNPWTTYGASKSANIQFALGLSKRWAKDGVTTFSLHPGVIATELMADLSKEDQMAVGLMNPDGTPGSMMTWKTIPQGAATHIVAAFDPTIVSASGSYLKDCQLANQETRPWALVDASADRLWALSEELLGETFA